MIDFIVATDKLLSLDCADDIAAFLQSQGVVGNKGSAASCPISNWVSSVTGRIVTTTSDDVNSINEKGGWECVDTSAAMSEFVWRFDDGGYPNLINGYAE